MSVKKPASKNICSRVSPPKREDITNDCVWKNSQKYSQLHFRVVFSPNCKLKMFVSQLLGRPLKMFCQCRFTVFTSCGTKTRISLLILTTNPRLALTLLQLAKWLSMSTKADIPIPTRLISSDGYSNTSGCFGCSHLGVECPDTCWGRKNRSLCFFSVLWSFSL